MIFLDTSAIYALADRDDPHHQQAKGLFQDILSSEEGILTHSYVLVESMALIQFRLGLDASLKLAHSVSAFEIVWIDAAIHQEAVRKLDSSRSQSSLVDQVSFAIMRARNLDEALSFNRNFELEGFRIYSGKP